MEFFKISCFNIPSPLLMFPVEEENKVCLFSLTNKREYELKVDLEKIQNWRFVGSSHGWLVILNEKADPILLNIFSGICHQLPGKETFPHIDSMHEVENEVFEIHYKSWNYSVTHSSETLRQLSVVKAVLSSDPSCDANCTVIVMYYVLGTSKLAFCRLGDSRWTGFGGEIQSYYDVVCKDNMLYALGGGPSIEVWDFHESTPTRKIVIQAPCPQELKEAHQIYPSDLYSSQWYLVFSSCEMFLVVRYIGEFVRYDGEVVYEGDTLTNYFIFPYRTIKFHVYKLDFDQKIWLPVESLDDRALFVGGNHSVSLSVKEHPGCNANSIYFTDDYWDRMNEHDSYGGHDMGIFKLGDGRIEQLFDYDLQKFELPPFWIVPN
ncbi:F-box protein SKIP23 [Forsythia ovata]|uniref:F-box protein SKIP23 n=1 Tax=Forsythia ovata TaxID=205694 RepID=A0ABD1PIK0_9LAMI